MRMMNDPKNTKRRGQRSRIPSRRMFTFWKMLEPISIHLQPLPRSKAPGRLEKLSKSAWKMIDRCLEPFTKIARLVNPRWIGRDSCRLCFDGCTGVDSRWRASSFRVINNAKSWAQCRRGSFTPSRRRRTRGVQTKLLESPRVSRTPRGVVRPFRGSLFLGDWSLTQYPFFLVSNLMLGVTKIA